MTIVCHT